MTTKSKAVPAVAAPTRSAVGLRGSLNGWTNEEHRDALKKALVGTRYHFTRDGELVLLSHLMQVADVHLGWLDAKQYARFKIRMELEEGNTVWSDEIVQWKDIETGIFSAGSSSQQTVTTLLKVAHAIDAELEDVTREIFQQLEAELPR
ncbi:hypothetical protein GAO09_08525 [Rhizobiales bacterium RZME27]|uniref:Uncharacterized protein n=1 Tax=Endobacterium cereale TaxID=2663029 RepID=A0A6A8A5D8_9HYPH|nr:hypothetical protein [Endobacterium cereale]MEB2848232.1 hypothetical protein [Endobacterium cereale]MQY46099.1 hypothetical protein [Endobacterium cereale]